MCSSFAKSCCFCNTFRRHRCHRPNFFCGLCHHLIVETGTASLNGLNLQLAPGKTVETRRQFLAIKELALARLDGTQSETGSAANCAN